MDPASLFSMETMSAAMTNAPKSIPVLSNIVKLATDIRETTERVEVNRQQSERLSQRIDTLIGFLAERDFSGRLTDSMHLALNRFENFLQECLAFISTFLETTWFKRVVNNRDHEKKFLDLNRELTQYSNDLNFGIGLSNLKVIKDHPEESAHAAPKERPSQELSETEDNATYDPTRYEKPSPVRIFFLLFIKLLRSVCQTGLEKKPSNARKHSLRIWNLGIPVHSIQSVVRHVPTSDRF